MSGQELVDLGREGLWTLIIVIAPVMIVGLVVGVGIALFQALTQIQEMTLVFAPKIVAIFIALMVSLPFMGQRMGDYMALVMEKVVQGGLPTGL